MHRAAWLALLPLLATASTSADVRRYLDDWNASAALSAARSLVAAKATAGQPSLEYAEALDLLGESLTLAGDPVALQVLDDALRLKTGLLAPGDLSFASTQRRRAAELMGQRKYAPAVTEYLRALAIVDGRPGDQAAKLRPAILLGLGDAYTLIGLAKEARASLEAALLAAGNEFGQNSLPARDVFRTLSNLSYSENNMPAAEQFLARATPGPAAHPVESAQLRLISAFLALERGRYGESAENLREAIVFHETRLGVRNRSLVPILRNLTRCYRFQGQFQPATVAIERALAISVEAFGEQSPATSQLLGLFASIKAESGQLAEARQVYDRALAILVRTLGPTHSLVGFELFSLANLEQVMGDFESSLRHASQSLTIRETTEGKQSTRTAPIYALLGRVNAMNGNLAKGRELTELAVSIGRRTVGDNHARTVFALSDLGEVLYLSRDSSGAQRYLTESLAGQVRLHGAGTLRTAQGEYNLGLAELAMQHHAEALDRFRRAGRIWREAFGPDYLFLAETNAGEAAALAALQRSAEALQPALEAARVRRTSLSAVSMSAAEREALLFARVDRDGILLAIDLAAGGALDATSIASVWDAVVRDRAAVHDAVARRRQAGQAGGDRIAQLKKELAQAAFVSDPRIYRDRVTSLRESLDAAERELARENVVIGRQAGAARAGLQEVLAALPPGAALVGYARGEANYVAFLGQPGQAIRAVSLGSISRVDALVLAWQQELERERNSAGRNARRNEAAYRQAGLALRRAIWDPLRSQLADARTVFTAPDGTLQLVNLDTLPVGTTQYLAETGPFFEILSSERDLVSPSPASTGPTGTLLAFGNPGPATLPSPAQQRGAGRCTDLHPSRFPQLPGSGFEAQAVGQLWTSRRSRSQVLTGAAATESAFKSLSAGKQILHLAMHGFFLSTGCQPEREALLKANPLLRSGLVLAAGGAGQDDGLLTAEEVSALRLETTELVVLSGCDTARGAIEAGEGLLGLRRAFHTAGAHHVVSSLWPIEDGATRKWMLRFYQTRLKPGTGVARSVRSASVAALRERRDSSLSTHPFYWGSFVASGF